MAAFLDCRIDSDAILADIEAISAIESPTSDVAGVNRVLDVIAGWFAGTGAAIERFAIDDRFGDMLRVRCNPERNEPGILVLSHVDTVHPLGTLASALPIRREGDKVFGPGIYDMKGGLVLALAAWRGLARAGVRTPLPVTFLFNPDEEVGSVGSRRHIEAEGDRSRYVLVTEPKRAGGRIVTERKGTGRFVIRTRGRPAHAGAAHHKGRSAIRAMARIILEVEGFTDYKRGITTNVGLVSGGSGVNVIPEHCTINADLRVTDLAAAAEMEERFRGLGSGEQGRRGHGHGRAAPAAVRARASCRGPVREGWRGGGAHRASGSRAMGSRGADRTAISRPPAASPRSTASASTATAPTPTTSTCWCPRSSRGRA